MKKCLGYNIRKIRELKNISQDYVAKHLGISQASYSSLEGDKVKIDEKKLIRIAAALNIDINVILNFNVQAVFDLCLSERSNISPLEKLQMVYEKLLIEKDSRIKLLEKLLNKESESANLSQPCTHFCDQ